MLGVTPADRLTAIYDAAPEQLTGAAIDGRADQYALACTASHRCAAVPELEPGNRDRAASAVPPQISDHRRDLAALNPVFARAMAKQPAARFDRCLDFATALVHSGAGIPATDGPTAVTSPLRHPSPPRRRRRRARSVDDALCGGPLPWPEAL